MQTALQQPSLILIQSYDTPRTLHTTMNTLERESEQELRWKRMSFGEVFAAIWQHHPNIACTNGPYSQVCW